LRFEEAEGFNLLRFLELIPVDPVLLVHAAAFARFPDLEGLEAPVPQIGEAIADRPSRLQTETGPAHEALNRCDRFLDAAGALADPSLDVEQQEAAQVVRRLGESAPR